MDLITAESDPKRPRHMRTERLLQIRPEALVEAVQIINTHRDEVERVMTRYRLQGTLAPCPDISTAIFPTRTSTASARSQAADGQRNCTVE